MGDQVLAALSQYGSPALFAAVLVAAIGVPLPVTLLLVVTGSLISQGVMNLWWSIGVASAGSIVGDQIGYAIGRWGGTRLVSKCIALLGGRERMAQAEAKARLYLFITVGLVEAMYFINLAFMAFFVFVLYKK